MKTDLHCHSYYSDGKHSPAFLIERAVANGVTHLAVTDHDCTDGLQEVVPPSGLMLIPGVEISCRWETGEIHVVGLCIDPADTALQNLLQQQQQRRRTRAADISSKLAALGCHGLMEYLETLRAVAYTRSHIADFLVTGGVVKTRQKAFSNYLNRKGKAFVPGLWCELEDAITAIRHAGGISVLAHPGRYPLNRSKRHGLIKGFADAGGDALECSYPNIAIEMNRELVKLAGVHGLMISCGSDFHDASAHWTDVGRFPPLATDTDELAVWRHPAWQSDSL